MCAIATPFQPVHQASCGNGGQDPQGQAHTSHSHLWLDPLVLLFLRRGWRLDDDAVAVGRQRVGKQCLLQRVITLQGLAAGKLLCAQTFCEGIQGQQLIAPTPYVSSQELLQGSHTLYSTACWLVIGVFTKRHSLHTPNHTSAAPFVSRPHLQQLLVAELLHAQVQ